MSGDLKVYGEPRIATGAQGRAVHLSRLVLWLMERHECTRVTAVEMLLKHLESEDGPVIYQASPGDDGRPLDMGRSWYPSDDGSLEKVRPMGRRVRYRGIGSGGVPLPKLPAPPIAPIGVGRVGLATWLRRTWGVARNENTVLELCGAYLIVAETDACALYGWPSSTGEPAADVLAQAPAALAIAAQDVTDWPSLVQYRLQFAPAKSEKRKPLGWPLGQVEILAERLRKECGVSMRGPLQRLAKESGLSRQSMQQALARNGFNPATGQKTQISATNPMQLVSRQRKSA